MNLIINFVAQKYHQSRRLADICDSHTEPFINCSVFGMKVRSKCRRNNEDGIHDNGMIVVKDHKKGSKPEVIEHKKSREPIKEHGLNK